MPPHPLLCTDLFSHWLRRSGHHVPSPSTPGNHAGPGWQALAAAGQLGPGKAAQGTQGTQ